ncbi:conjugal transfer protein [Sphingomonas sp. BK580]|uniref:conjugal transfer protein n=1 Tax=Sphingomonas sp. BK580 TaxID=2586972 RepID=UPI00161C1669|nr:conjugal transfer protein [Sphingomonas sp. BK580]MBB3694944.1 conjugal transfer pilus assembly protein TraV [Sphingomonas sp. BK580]
MTATKLGALALILAGTGLASCTTLGGNIKGNFSCIAPDGICAPSSTIDDRALALIAGEDGDRMITPAGPYSAPATDGRGDQSIAARNVAGGFQSAAATPARSQERVLRIVFPAQIDAAGRLREQTAIHAVVQRGEWQRELASNAVATTPAEVASATGGDTLLAAVDRADPPMTGDAEAGVDPDMPSAAAVAAARAPADPVGDIKDQVARQLARNPRRMPASTTPVYRQPRAPITVPAAPSSARANTLTPLPAATAPQARTATTQAVGTTKPATPSPSAPARAATRPTATSAITVPTHATQAGRTALASVGASPAIRAGLARAEPEAREAAKANGVIPVLRAPSFPGVDQ